MVKHACGPADCLAAISGESLREGRLKGSSSSSSVAFTTLQQQLKTPKTEKKTHPEAHFSVSYFKS